MITRQIAIQNAPRDLKRFADAVFNMDTVPDIMSSSSSADGVYDVEFDRSETKIEGDELIYRRSPEETANFIASSTRSGSTTIKVGRQG